MNRVYQIECVRDNALWTIKIRAINIREAKRIAKEYTGALIKNMRLICIMGSMFRAENDGD